MSSLQFSEQEQPSLFSHPLIFSFLPFLLVLFITKWLFTTRRTQKNLPPSPPKLPFVGNIHQLGLLPHRSLRSLAQKHGPIMLLHFGRVPALVVSSVEGAREIFKTHDIILSNRPKSTITQRVLYDYKDLIMAPYGEYWRQARSIYVLQLLSNRRVESFHTVRLEEIALIVEKIRESSALSSPVNLSEMLASLMNNVVSRAALGRKYGEGESGQKFKQLLREMGEILGGVDIGEFLPWLAWINRFNGFNAKVGQVPKGLDQFLDGVIKDRKNGVRRDSIGVGNVEERDRADFLDILLDAYRADTAPERDCIKALILTVFIAATDSSTTFLEWAMTELFRHPRVMKKLQAEVREVLNRRLNVMEDDLEKMHYLKAVIKETFRFHPPAPLLVPRAARQDVNIMGYDIVAGTAVMINFWAIGRDPALWDEPEEFRPERFMDSPIDFKGHDFRLVPFGSGRRGCPGISFAIALIELVLANLVHKFDWELPSGAKAENLDVTECIGSTVHRKNPLLALATPY